MAARRMKSNLHYARFLAELENGAAARFLRHQKRLFNFYAGKTGARQCRHDRFSLAGAIVVWRKILQGAAAADPEMRADRHAFDAASRYSTLPSPPSIGLSIW